MRIHRLISRVCVKRLRAGIFLGLAASVAIGAMNAPTAGKPGGGGSAPSWKIVMLADGGGGYLNGMPQAINAVGEIVGVIDEGAPFENRQAAYWALSSVGGTVQSNLRLLPGNGFIATGINDRGAIVGNGIGAGGQFAGLYWAGADALPQELPSLPGDDSSAAMAINFDGVVCGWSSDSEDAEVRRAVAWRVASDEAGAIILGPWALPGPASGSIAVAVNNVDSGGFAEIAGQFTTGTGMTAVVWEVHAAADGTLAVNPSVRVLDANASPYGINDAGAVCGVRGGQQPVVWSGSTATVLNLARNVYAASAYAINGSGLIVGTGEYQKNSLERGQRAVVWPNSRNSMILLDKFLPAGSPFTNLNHANAVDVQGRIVGFGWRGSVGRSAAFVAVPQ